MNTPITCPECTQGKHDNCDGTSFDLDSDAVTVCACALDWHGKPVVTTTATAAPSDVRTADRAGEARDGTAHVAAGCTDQCRQITAAHDSEHKRALAERETLAAKIARVEALAIWFEQQPNWREWGVHTQIRAALRDRDRNRRSRRRS